MKEEAKAKDKPEQTNKVKIHKDFGFLLNITPIILNARTAKYLLTDGEGETLKALQYPFESYYNFTKYDYQGRLIDKNSGIIKLASDKKDKFQELIMSMKVKERAWFNVCESPIHVVPKIMEQIQSGFIIQDENMSDDDEVNSKEETTLNQTVNLSGFHLQIYLDKIQYRNGESITVKRLVYSQEREKGKQLFMEAKYYQAAKNYKFIIHITENLPKNKYNQDQLLEIEGMNIHSKFNFLKCFLKIQEDWCVREFEQLSKQCLDYLLQKTPSNEVTHFLNAKWNLKYKMFGNALEAAKKSNSIKNTIQTDLLIKQILKDKANKGKIKVIKNMFQQNKN